MDAKTIFTSKTFWVNLLAIIGLFVAGNYVEPGQWAELSAGVLALVNILLRILTKSEIVWKAE